MGFFYDPVQMKWWGPPIPLRGSISYGDFTALPDAIIDTNFVGKIPAPTFFGKAIVLAAEWEKNQDWVGVSIDPHSLELLRQEHPALVIALMTENRLVKWDVPTKKGLTPSLAVNYVIGSHGASLIESIERLQVDAPANAKLKYQAARTFVEQVERSKMHC